jgi:membrane-associated phospholipid phosphatase
VVNRSTDALHWSKPVTVFAAPRTGFADKDWITCDNTPSSRHYGNCYAEFDLASADDLVEMSVSTNGGRTWLSPKPTAGRAFGLGGQPLVQPNGTVVVPYLGLAATPYFGSFVSTNGGASRSAHHVVSDIDMALDAGGIRNPGGWTCSRQNDAPQKFLGNRKRRVVGGIVTPRRGEATMRHRGRPLLRDARRTRAWPVLATCVIVIATLGVLLREQARPDGFDSVVDTAMVASFSGHQGVLPWLALPGSTIPLIAASVAIAVGCLIARRPNGVALAVTAVPVTAFLDDTVLKHLVDRTHLGQLSFPSGHTASAMTLATVLGVLVHDPARRTATRVVGAALVIAACAVTVLVAAGVIGLRWHYFTDTVGGIALGTGTVLTLAFLIDLVPGVIRPCR